MKKMLSALLLIVMLCQVLPFDALAAVGRVLTDDELARAYALTGLGENEGQYHNGMRPNASWNAVQLIHYLESRLSTDIYNLGDIISRAEYAVAELKQTNPAAYREYMESGADESLEQLRVEAEALRQEMRYYKTHLEECAGLIAELSHAMQDDGKSMFDSEKVRYSARIEEAVKNLTADRQYVAENIDAWEAKANKLRDYLQVGPYGSDEDDLYIGDILGELFKAEAPVHNTAKVTAVTASNTRLSRLAADAGMASNDVDFSIYVMTEHQVGISLCREVNKKRVPVTDVTVTVKDILNPKAQEIRGEIDNLGNVMFESNKFTTDEYDCVRLQLKIDGGNKYKSIVIDDLDLDLGVPFEIVMETLGASSNGAGETANAPGDPYLVSAEFNGKDILYSNYNMLYSPVNDYNFEIKVVAANISGSPIMTMTWYENDGANRPLKQCTATAEPQEGNVYIFKGPWKQRFSPNANDDQHRPTFSFGGANATKKTSRLISNRSAADQPINAGTGAGGGVFGKVMGQGMGFSTDIPLGGDHKIHIGLNLPFTEYLPQMNIGTDGSITIWIGTDVFGDVVKEVTKDWKSKDLKVLRRAEEKLEKTTTLADYKAKMALNYNYSRVRKLKFIAEGKINFGIFGVARGHWNLKSDDPDVKTTLITLNVGAGIMMNCEYSWGWQFIVGPVPVNVSFSLGLSVGFGFELQLQLCWINNQFQNWKFLIMKEVDVSIGLYFGAQLGVGLKGFLEAYVKFTAILNIMLRLSVQDKQPSSVTITWGCSLTVGATVFFLDFNYTWNFLHGQLYPNVEMNLLDHYMNADAKASQPEEPAHQDPQDYPQLAVAATQLRALPANTPAVTKLMTIEGDNWLFFLQKEDSGDTRLHWRNLKTGLEQSIEHAYSQLRQYQSYQHTAQIAGTNDYAFDVWYGEDLLIIVRCFANAFDENGYPDESSNCDMLVLERQGNGSFQPIFSKTKLNGTADSDEIELRSLLAYGDFWKDYPVMTNPVIDDVRLVWDDRSTRRLRGIRMRGMMSRVVDPNKSEDGVVFFCYNDLRFWNADSGSMKPRHMILHTDGHMGRFDGYRRVQYLSPLRPMDYYDRYMGDGVYGFEEGAQDFIALNRSETDKADAFIELYDMHINGVRDKDGNWYDTTREMKGIKIAEGDIRYMVLLPTGEDGVNRLFYTQAEKDADGAEHLRLHGLKIQPTKEREKDNSTFDVEVTRYDYDTVINADRFQVGYIANMPYLYWYNAVAKDNDVNSLVWRVWAAAYDPASEIVSAPGVLAQFELPKVRIQTGTKIEEIPIYDAIRGNAKTREKVPVYEVVNVIPINIELNTSGTGYFVAMVEKVIEGESLPRAMLYSFTETIKPVGSLTSAIPQHTLVKAGSYEDVDVGVMNEGNTAMVAFDIEMREVDKNGVEGPLVETVHVNCHEPEKSTITMANAKGPILTGKEVAHRAEDFDFSPRQRDFILSQATINYTVDISHGVNATAKEISPSAPKHLTSDLVMPGSLADIMASFKIPGNWSGQKKLRLRVVNASVHSNWLRTMANAAGLAANADDGSEPVLLEYKLDRERNVMVLQRPAVSNAAVENAIESGIFANEVEAGDPVDLMVHVQDIDVDHRVYAGWDGQDWLSFSVKNHAATGDQLKLTCAVYVDDAEEPYYLNLPYYKQATSTRRTQTFCAPLSALVDDVNLHQQARLVISAVGVEESAWINNEFTVNLAGANPLRFVRQPEDVVAQEGEDVAFTVEVTGGVKPYACQWQVWDPKHEKWVDLPGFTDPTLSRKDIEKKWDGARFRCVVTDAEGTQIISREVTLTVRKGVDTGDNSNLPLYLAVALGALALLWFMRRRSLRG